MSIKETLLQGLDKGIDNMNNEKLTQLRREMVPKRIQGNREVYNKVRDIDFQYAILDEFTDMVSPYGTFFDGSTFYYDDNFEKLSTHQKIMIAFTEFFNLWQGYYSNGMLTSNNAKKIRSITLLCMYHIGLVPNKVNYAQSQRGSLWEAYNKKYPNHDIITFKPNKNAAKYLYIQLMLNKDKTLGIVEVKFETTEAIEANVKYMGVGIKEGSICINYDWQSSKVCFSKLVNHRITYKNKLMDPIKTAKSLINAN